ncbi:hypothetical protein RHSIM_Rhsim05G0166600 [Rhododendron simsii]|uniref:Retrotransposon gag domain-containing protein n=1 Tax=Rhododendron simsii TaxID=118357 RepID=A0A834H1J5_RHOSS|nr:hypothetical protein RHSIM_Rhsim05G0166600 [Rhododendron simsii]
MSEELRVDDPFYISPSDSPTAKKPGEDKEKEVSRWERCNDLVAPWILNSVPDEIRSSILFAHTARAIWIDLSDRFLQSNAPQIYQLTVQSISALKQEELSVSAYFTKLKSLWDELNSLQVFQPCTCGSGKFFSERLQQYRAMEFLQGLHDRFGPLRSQILLMEPLPNATKIYSLVRQEEKQQEIQSLSTPIPDAAALNITTRSNNYNSNRLMDGRNSHNTGGGNRPHPSSGNRSYSGDGNSFHSSGRNRSNPGGGNGTYTGGGSNSSGSGYNSYSGSGNNSNRKVKYHCDHCDKDGHSTERCYKIIGYPPKRSEFSNLSTKSANKTSPAVVTQEQYDKLLAMLYSGNIHHNSNLAGIALSIPPTSVWIIDTGATNHMCSSLTLFTTYKSCPTQSFVQLPDGSSTQITHIGTIKLSPTLALENVFHIPSFKYNLLSSLAVCVMLAMRMLTINSINVPNLAYSLATLMVKRVIEFMTYSHTPFIHPVTSFFTKAYFHSVMSLQNLYPLLQVFPCQTMLMMIPLDFPPIATNPITHTPPEVAPTSSPIPNEPIASDLITPVEVQEPIVPALSIPALPTTGRPSRSRRPPSHLADYHCSGATHGSSPLPSDFSFTGTPYPLHHFLSSSNFSVGHRSFLSAVSSLDEPRTFSQAVQLPQWRDAMEKEIIALETNNTWDLF